MELFLARLDIDNMYNVLPDFWLANRYIVIIFCLSGVVI
ncbi:hypothetical protein SAMN05216339_101510 [Nitrosomonas eutropha]|uniref:Uncharacterized protein n=1 Tax=Nitrosomonas eutropha TaxID=916 RepID=A0A1I7FI50_9PROT|nr:hypothetical protein SAMN05216339_101510 [Nitrosomonas eutropha]